MEKESEARASRTTAEIPYIISDALLLGQAKAMEDVTINPMLSMCNALCIWRKPQPFHDGKQRPKQGS